MYSGKAFSTSYGLSAKRLFEAKSEWSSFEWMEVFKLSLACTVNKKKLKKSL